MVLRIFVKPITESLLRKPRKKQVLMVPVQEGNTLAPTRRARAKRTQGGQGRKPPRVFKPKTGGSIMECTNPIPDLNEIPLVMDSPPPPAKAVKKRAPRKKKAQCNADCGLLPSSSVTEGNFGLLTSAKPARKRGPTKNKANAKAQHAVSSESHVDEVISTKGKSDVAITTDGHVLSEGVHVQTLIHSDSFKVCQATPCSATNVERSSVRLEELACGGYVRDTGMFFPPDYDIVIEDCPPEEGPGEVLNPVQIEASFPVRSGTIEGMRVTMKVKIHRDSKKKWGQSIKRGCISQFTVKTLLYLSHVSEISIIQEKHVNSDGLVVHGGMNLGDRSAFSAHLSLEIRAFIEDCLRKKDTPNQIMRKHLDILKKYRVEDKDITRDLLLTTKDIRNISGKLAQETYMLHKNDAQSVRMWVQRNPEKVFHYSESNQKTHVKVQGELAGENMLLQIGCYFSWSLLQGVCSLGFPSF